MVHVSVILSFTSPALANSLRPEDGKEAADQFIRDIGDRVVIPQAQLLAMLTKAHSLSPSAFRFSESTFDTSFKAQTEVYPRRYSLRGQPQVRKHESIPSGTTIELRMYVPDGTPSDEIWNLFNTAGKFVGLSPYGHKLGYGRFNVVSVTVKQPSRASDTVFVPGE